MDLHDDLMRKVKKRAASDGRTVTSVVEEALTMLLAKMDEPQEPITLPTHGGGVQPGVDLSNWQTVKDQIDREDVEKFQAVMRDAAS